MANSIRALVFLVLLASCVGSGRSRDAIKKDGGSTKRSAGADKDEIKRSRPLTPDEALQSFRLDSLFRIEIFAVEPYVRDPVDLAFDEHGRAFVAEMLDYPEESGPPQSRIRLLKDNDGDGRIDDAVVFADGIRLITGIQPWDGGLMVTSAPDILFLRDTDGDGVADERRTLFTGFAEANPQHRVSSPRFAIDNWIYVGNDGAPGRIRPHPATGEESVSVLGADFRFQLPIGDEGELRFEPASGPAQFGQAFDAFGRRFITHNTIHIRHVVLPRRYFERNPYLTSTASAHDISEHGLRVYQTSISQQWRVARTEARQERYAAEGLDRTEHRADVFTAVAGAVIVGEGAFPPAYRGNFFTGETAANLVHRDVLVPEGATFIAKRAPGDRESEFLTSTDPWFRPSNLVVGPDGYLYVVDMYREFIESPEYIPEAIRREINFRSGTEYGRIYRILPNDHSTTRFAPIADARSEALTGMLADPNPWRRLTAHRVLVERRDGSLTPLLDSLARHGEEAYARLHALYVLDAYGMMTMDLAAAALSDWHPGVREHALRFAESFPALERRAVELADDPSQHVRLQAALTLGRFSTEASDSALVEIAVRDDLDRWMVAAILSAPSQRASSLAVKLLRNNRFLRAKTDARSRLLRGLASIIGARGDDDEIGELAIHLSDDSELEAWREPAFSGLAGGLALRGLRQLDMPEVRQALDTLLAETTGPTEKSVLRAARHFLMPGRAARAVRIAGDSSAPADLRAAAAEDLVMARFGSAERVLGELLESDDPSLQAAAVQTFSRFKTDRVARDILDRWDGLGLALRPVAAGVLASRNAWTLNLLEALSADAVDPEIFETDTRLRLLDHPDERIRRRAEALLGRTPPQNVVAAFGAALDLTADAVRGRTLFYRECARCHASNRRRALGPDLVGVSNKGGEQLLEAIVAPSGAIPSTYAAYVAELSDGSVVSGRLIRETPGNLTFLSETGERTVLRTDVRALRAAERSMMPDDYSRRLSEQDLADLVAFLQAGTGI